MTEAGALLRLMARTLQSDQAQNLFDTLQGLQMMGKAFLGSSKKPDWWSPGGEVARSSTS